MSETYLVAGGCGFIGSNFVHLALEREPGAQVVVVDNLSFAANEPNLDAVRDRIELVVADICDFAAMLALWRRVEPDYVVNFAAESHNDRAVLDPSSFARTNALGAQTLVEASRRHPVQRHLHVSTIEVYGELAAAAPFFTEASALNAKTPYSAAKAAGDQLVRAYMQTYREMDLALTHCANNYGPYQFPEKLIPLMLLNALDGRDLPVYGDGRNVRDWIYVEDHCRGVLAALERGRPGRRYNFGGRSERTNLEIVGALCAALERHAPAADNPALAARGKAGYAELVTFVADRPGHDRRYAIDDALARRELDWAPRYDLDAGLDATVRWYLDHRAWAEAVQARGYRRERLGLAAGPEPRSKTAPGATAGARP